jgi:type III restriction enzyme
MPPTVIENPILNSPYREPTRHFRSGANNDITNVIDAGRRGRCYFLPIATPKKKSAPGLLDTASRRGQRPREPHSAAGQGVA